MFDELINRQIERFQPVAAVAAEEARSWATHLLHELRAIRSAIEADDVTYIRNPPYVFTLPNAQLQPGFIEVPGTDVWWLESVVLVGSGGIFSLVDSQGIPRYVKETGLLGSTDGPSGVRLTGGTQLTPTISAAGPVSVRLVFRTDRPAPGKPAPGAGRPELPASAGHLGALQVLDRHVPTLNGQTPPR